MKPGVTNLSASVHARLLNKAKAEARPFQELLQYYAMECFLRRLSRTRHSKSYVLKGALMLQFWGAELVRSTKDIDLLGHGPSHVDELVTVLRECLEADVEPDGVVFETASVRGREIRIAAGYAGVRLTFEGFLGKARIPLQVDVGFGDAIRPEPWTIRYPSLLEFDDFELEGYPPEAAIAEKIEAMVVLELANSRLKDYFDVWLLTERKSFDASVLADAVSATFARRGTALPEGLPPGLGPEFAAAKGKQAQWAGWKRQARVGVDTPELADVVARLARFAGPIFDELTEGRTGSELGTWSPGGPWGRPATRS